MVVDLGPPVAYTVGMTRPTGERWHQVWFGHLALSEALSRGEITVEGPADLVRSVPRWLTLSPFAPRVAAHREGSSTQAAR